MTQIDAAEVALRLAVVRQRIVDAGGHLDGPRAVEVVAVTKTFGVEAIRAARDAGCRAVGENYAQELSAKWAELDDTESRPSAHFIGRLQSNKIRSIAPIVDLWQTVDRASVVDELGRRCRDARVLIQVNAAGEEGKGGCRPDEVDALMGHAGDAGVEVLGFMTVGPTSGTAEDARPAFALVRELCDRWDLPICSMGMSHDLEVAVEEGSNMVRIGTALFGAR
jgi:PLP dependent protein